MNNISKIVIFGAGVIVGSIVTWKLTKTKYEQFAKEEIDQMRDYIRTKEKMLNDETKSDSDMHDYVKKIYDEGYSSTTNNEKKGDPVMTDRPYVIAPEEFDENDYQTVSLTYYADKVLADDWDNIIEDVDGTVGSDSLTHFGEYEDDSVYVRNDDLKTDYEILLDVRNYHDLHPVKE